MRFLRESRQEDTSKTNRLKVADITHSFHHCTIATQRNLKLIPLHTRFLFIFQPHSSFHDASDMLLSHAHHVLRTERNMITIESLIVIQRIIRINILDIWLQCRSRSIWITLTHLWRVALCAIKVFISQEHRHLSAIKIISAVVVIIISCRVIQWREIILLPHSQHRLINLTTQCRHIVGIWLLSLVFKIPFLIC